MSATAIVGRDFGPGSCKSRPPAGEIVSLAAGLDVPGVILGFQRDEEIFAQESDASHFYKVVSGAVRVTRLMSDGRRHIASFHFVDDVFGLEFGATHGFSAEAITPCRIACVKRSAIGAQTNRDGFSMDELWRLVTEELHRVQEHSLLLGRMTAAERVTSFLHGMASRRHTKSVVDLPMSRLDIADHLGLTIETVSRTLTQLQRQGAIAIEGTRHIVLNREPAQERWAA